MDKFVQGDIPDDKDTNHVNSTFTRMSQDDPFQHLPVEIMIQVWSHISMMDLLHSCMLVSKRWRDQLLQCGDLWSEATLHHKDGVSPTALSSVSNHIDRLHLFYLSCRWLTGFHHQITRGGSFESITHLTIMLGGQEHVEEQMLVQMFEKLGCTLKSLYCQTLQNFPDLAVVTRTCPRLHSLVYKNSHGLFNLDALEPYPGELKSLTIENHCIDAIERDQFVTIISNLGRHLQALSVFPCGQECISDVQQYCPDIQTLVWNCGSPKLDEIHPSSPSSRGLRLLSIAPNHFELVIDLMERYKDTLETLHLTLVLLRSCRQLDRLKHVAMKRLYSLSLGWVRDHDTGTHIAAAILDTCQESLRVLSLENLHMTPLIRHLSRLNHLESLRLDSVVHSKNMASYWDHSSNHGILMSLELRNVDITDRDLVFLARVDSLKNLTLSFTDDHHQRCQCTDDGIQSYFIGTKSALRNVVLDLAPISWSTLDTLGRIPSLRNVTVSKHAPIQHVDKFRRRYPRLWIEMMKEKEHDIYSFC